MVDWAELPYDLVELVANKLLDCADFVMFATVCRSWHLVHVNRGWKPRQIMPWLMLGQHEKDSTKTRLFSLSRYRLYSLTLPEESGRNYLRKPCCWLVGSGQDAIGRAIELNSRGSVSDPTNSMLEIGRSPRLKKAYHLYNPGHDEYIRISILKTNRLMAFSTQSNNHWTMLRFPEPVDLLHVIFFKGKILAISMSGTLMHLDIDRPEEPKGLFVAAPPEKEQLWSDIFLVKWSDKLLAVFYYKDDVKFHIYTLDLLKRKWMQLDDLGDAVMLVDAYGAIVVPAYDILKPNYIYCVNKYSDLMTLYNIKQKTRVVCRIIDDRSLMEVCPAWILPSLW